MATNFSAQVDAWTRQTDKRLRAVFLESAQRTVAKMQRTVAEGGSMPVDTGFLRASLVGSVDKPIAADREPPKDGGKASYDPGPINLLIATGGIEHVIYASYTARYAPHVEWGTVNHPPRPFVRLAAMQWQRTVDEVIAELKGRAL